MSILPRLQRSVLLTAGCGSHAPKLAAIASTNAVIARQAASSTAVARDADFWKKNKQLNRPISPYMIYKPQITWTLSITHRLTGAAAGALMYGFGLYSLGSSSTFPQLVDAISQAVPHSAIVGIKAILLTSLAFHSLNGVRHLLWDMGYGFKLRELYTSGYIVIALTVLVGIASLLKG